MKKMWYIHSSIDGQYLFAFHEHFNKSGPYSISSNNLLQKFAKSKRDLNTSRKINESQ